LQKLSNNKDEIFGVLTI